jgi:hypothetical protein
VKLPKYKNKITNKDGKVLLKIYILKRIRIAQFNLKKIDFKDEKIRRRLQKQLDKNRFNIETIKFLKKLDYIVEKLNLKIKIGIEDAAITAISVGILYTIISNILRNKIRDYDEIKYEIKPVYNDKNILEIELDSIINLKFENILNIIKFLRKGSVNKNVRTSNRKSYAFSNE